MVLISIRYCLQPHPNNIPIINYEFEEFVAICQYVFMGVFMNLQNTVKTGLEEAGPVGDTVSNVSNASNATGQIGTIVRTLAEERLSPAISLVRLPTLSLIGSLAARISNPLMFASTALIVGHDVEKHRYNHAAETAMATAFCWSGSVAGIATAVFINRMLPGVFNLPLLTVAFNLLGGAGGNTIGPVIARKISKVEQNLSALFSHKSALPPAITTPTAPPALLPIQQP